MNRRATLGLVVIAALMACAAFWLRRATVRAFFDDGIGEAALPEPGTGSGLEPIDHVRVIVLDGLSRAHADTLPNLTALCDRGLRLDVDNGFPTVSLPVQQVLWTGLTQQQSGSWYRIPRLERPPHGSLPAQVPGSVGVAESHPDIVGSFGFASAMPPAGEEWDEHAFVAAATEAVGSDAALAFVHVLRIDEAGHAHGAASDEYASAADWADERLGEWVSAAPPRTRWFVLADHGHLSGGGHGGPEPEIRIVRACVLGELGSALPREGALLLIDLSRALADSLGRSEVPPAAGRPLTAALEHPRLGVTLPAPSSARWGLATLALLAGLAIARVLGPGAWSFAPWWLALAYASLLGFHGRPTLSNPAIYPPYGQAMLLAGLPGFVLLGATAWWVSRSRPFWRYAAAQLATIAGITSAFAILCGAPQVLLGTTTQPPLMPTWTAHTSVALSLCLGSATTLVLVGVAVAASRGGGHSGR